MKRSIKQLHSAESIARQHLFTQQPLLRLEFTLSSCQPSRAFSAHSDRKITAPVAFHHGQPAFVS
jgi:hypothetical protein